MSANKLTDNATNSTIGGNRSVFCICAVLNLPLLAISDNATNAINVVSAMDKAAIHAVFNIGLGASWGAIVPIYSGILSLHRYVFSVFSINFISFSAFFRAFPGVDSLNERRFR